jgi:hypothetical protein
MPPHTGYRCDVGHAALPSLDLHCRHSGAVQAWQQLQGVEAGGLLQRVEDLATHVEAALAHRGVACGLVAGIAIHQHAVEPHATASIGMLVPAHEARRRTHSVPVRRGPGHVAGQLATTFDHDAETAECEDLQRNRCRRTEALHLLDRKHPRQHCARDSETLVVVAQGRLGGGRTLHRQVPRQIRMTAGGVVEHRHFCRDDGVGTEGGSTIHGGLPFLQSLAVRISIERQIDLPAVLVGVGDAATQVFLAEVEPGKGTGVGLVAEAGVDGIGTVVHGCHQGRKVTRGAYQLHRPSPGCGGSGDARASRGCQSLIWIRHASSSVAHAAVDARAASTRAQIASTRCSTAASGTIASLQRRCVSPGHLRVASRPSFEPRFGSGLAKSR